MNCQLTDRTKLKTVGGVFITQLSNYITSFTHFIVRTSQKLDSCTP